MSSARRYENGQIYNNPYHGDFSITRRGVNNWVRSLTLLSSVISHQNKPASGVMLTLGPG